MAPRISPRATLEPRTSLQEFRAGSAPIESKAFWGLMTAPFQEGAFDPEMILPHEEFRVLSKAASGGGYLVPGEVTDQIVANAVAQSAVAQLALTITTDTGDALSLPAATTLGTANWTAESGSYTASDEVYVQVALGAFKSTSMTVVSEELLTDSNIPLDALLALLAGIRLGTLQAAAFATGAGTTTPLGIVHASSTYTVTTAATGSSVLYKAADVLAAYKALAAPYRAAASWIMHPDDYASLAGTPDTAGAYAFPGLQTANPTLFGRPVYVDAAMPTPAASAKSCAFGDWQRAYAIRRVRGVGLQRLDEIRSDAGQITFRANERVDGRIGVPAAAVILAHSAT